MVCCVQAYDGLFHDKRPDRFGHIADLPDNPHTSEDRLANGLFIVEKADNALYRAKAQGKNRVEIWREAPRPDRSPQD